ncbi:MADS-box transcription factor family protein [Rhynchospora pubera]|uniref:MADS-box transcription factor family protein n=1 Tax=Rhynchospora pubera TaxID=906938 RepID=A0AAV8DIJ9_9POAL|nr:MADS-box transcription factor family protein [Rhynchospora pubera]
MGRNKIEIETRKTLLERKSIFDDRKNGLKKKAKELSILCDAPVMLLFSSPANEKSYELVMGDQCDFEEIVQRYAAVSSKKRYESKADTFEQLKKAFAKQGKTIDVDHELMGLHRDQSSIEDKQNYLCNLQAEMEEAEKALGVLRFVDNIDNIYDMKILEAMETALLAAHSHNNTHKDEFHQKQLTETANINQDIYPNQFNEITCAPQVNHQLQSLGLPLVADNVQGQFPVIGATGTSFQDSLTHSFRHLPLTREEEQWMNEGEGYTSTTTFDGASCSNITPQGITYREGWSLEDVIMRPQ